MEDGSIMRINDGKRCEMKKIMKDKNSSHILINTNKVAIFTDLTQEQSFWDKAVPS